MGGDSVGMNECSRMAARHICSALPSINTHQLCFQSEARSRRGRETGEVF